MRSKEQQDELARILEEVDYYIMWEKGMPALVRASSKRAKLLFMQWGVEDDVDGIAPPDNPMDLMDSIPMNWICGMESAEENKVYTVQEIPLPQPRVVLH